MLFVLSTFYRATNAVISPHLIRDLFLDPEGLGLITAAFFYAFALTQIPIGLVLDRVGPRRTMTVLSLLAVAGALIFARSDSLLVGILGRVLLGAGMACSLMGSLKLLTLWFGPDNFATLSGIIFAAGTIGSLAATTPLVLLVEMTGWRLAFNLIAAFNLLLTLVFYGLVRDRPQGNIHRSLPTEAAPSLHKTFQGLFLLFRKRDYWIISFATFFRFGIFSAIQTLWAVPYLMEVMGLSVLEAGNVIFLMSIGMTLGIPLWGVLSDRVLKTRRSVIFFASSILSLTILTMAMLPQRTGLPLLAFLFFTLGLSHGGGAIMYTHIKELMPIDMAGTAMTGINFFTMMGAAFFLQGLGNFMQYLYSKGFQVPYAFRVAFLSCGGMLAFVTFLYVFTRDARKISKD
jgi:sugar phosphate permease